MSKFTVEEIMLHRVKTFSEIVNVTDIKPSPDTWPSIALAIAVKYAPQMKPDGRGAPTYTINNMIFNHWCRLADVAHHKHQHGCTLEQARKKVGLPYGTYKLFRRTYKTLWRELKSNPEVARIMATDENRPKRDK